MAVYFGASVVFRMNVGQRHLLPLYPALFILVGGLFATAAADRALRRLRGLAIALLAWIAILFASAYPHYLSFFSIVAGGSERGHYSLIDSSLDWGQDLPAFKRWVDEHRKPDEVVYFSYFGSVSPGTEDIDAILTLSLEHNVFPIGQVTTVDQGPNQGGKAVYLRDPDGITVELIQKPVTSKR